MDMYTKKKLKNIIRVVLLVVSLLLIIIGQRTISYGSLGIMLVGLAGVLVVLYMYNRSYTKIESFYDEKPKDGDEK